MIFKKIENLTLPLWRPIEQEKNRRTIFHCVFYFIVCKPEYIVSHNYHRTLYYQKIAFSLFFSIVRVQVPYTITEQ